MAAKRTSRVTCCICNTEIAKEKTRSICKDKRACKIHEGVLEKANEIYSVQERQQQEKQERLQRKAEERERRAQDLATPFVPKCAVCKTPTVDYPLAVTGHNTCIYYAKDEEKPEDWERIAKACSFSEGIDWVGIARVCLPCAERLKFPNKFERAMEALRKVPLETLYLLGSMIMEDPKDEA